ncbi:MAG: hypothetical protein GY850_44675 [bacterium]|nr:hypothetical protein [bacterium]
MLEKETVAASIEQFIRNNFNIKEDTIGFSRSCDLFEGGFVDSVGLIKLISFLEREFDVHIEEEYLFDERFLSIDGESQLVSALMNQSIE